MRVRPAVRRVGATAAHLALLQLALGVVPAARPAVAAAAAADEAGTKRSALSREVCSVPPPASPPAPVADPATSTSSASTPSAEPAEEVVEDVVDATAATAGEMADATRRRLYQTACAANLWLDGLFGGTPDAAAARDITGRVELSALDQATGGTKLRAKVHAEFELPTLEGRLKGFIGRDDQDDFVADRHEGFALRSSLFGLEQEDKWLAGLGYGLPGRYFSDSDVRVGVKIKSSPEVFAQARYKKNWFPGERTAWRLRETVFWKNTRDGLGSTTSLDWDRMLTRSLLLRWGNIGTLSEATDGLAWRSALILYQNLSRAPDPGSAEAAYGTRARAIAYETFVRGQTGGVVAGEYGVRAVYRQAILRSYLFAEVVAGYSWPREEGRERKGSETLGIGLEMAFGR